MARKSTNHVTGQAEPAETKTTNTESAPEKKPRGRVKKATSVSTASSTSSTSSRPRKTTRVTRRTTAASSSRARTHTKSGKEAQSDSFARTSPQEFGRVNVMNVKPAPQNGFIPRAELGEQVAVQANVFIEGRRHVGASAAVYTKSGALFQRVLLTCTIAGLDQWNGQVRLGESETVLPWEPGFAAMAKKLGTWKLVVEGWEDSYAGWIHDARIKVETQDDQENTLEEGLHLFERWLGSKDAHLLVKDKKVLQKAIDALGDKSLTFEDRLAAADSLDVHKLHETKPLRDGVSPSNPVEIEVQRPHSSFSAWYQFFPRSEGAYVDEKTGKIVQGTLKTALSGLDRAKAEGFDIVYLPPIFPIGVTNRKGKNNALTAGPDDPGSPFGIGSDLGGHDTVDPLLGTMKDFEAFVAYAHKLGLEVALDFALQCSPDHPWVEQHPNWFHIKPDGTITFAENPPKKYQDIYPIDFEADMPGIEKEVERVLDLWISKGVTIFRVDNPHTKPVRFWQDVIAKVTKKHPQTLFLAEAFTRPSMMRALSYAGFTQSHCYFPWRNSAEELNEYLAETNSDEAFFQHNTYWPTTPDILTAYLRDNGIAGHAVRAVLAAMGSPSWGIYNGYELIENVQRGSFEEHNDNEKYEVKVRDWDRTKEYGIAKLLTRLNAIRRAHPATQTYHDLHMLETRNPAMVAFYRHLPAELSENGKSDTVIVVVNLDGHNAQQGQVHIELGDLGLTGSELRLKDELTGRDFTWSYDNYVSLAPWADVAHILTVRHPGDKD